MERLIVSVSGVRGIVGETLTPQVAYEFGCAFATMLGAGKTVALGRDSRPTGSMVKNALASGLMSCGVNVISLGIVTTPGAALMTRKLGADGGVVITASHNPTPYNGIKFLQPTGVALPAPQAKKLKQIWESGEFNLVEGPQIGKETVDHRTHAMHIESVCNITDIETVKQRGFKVVVDSINGAGCVVTPQLLAKLGCDVVHINGEPTGDFAHTPEPLKENLTDLCEAVRQHGADIGFAQDPDADRLVVIDEQGNYIGEEYTLALAGAFVLSHRKGKLAVNLSTSRMIDDVAAAAGVEVVRTPTGEANVVSGMEANDCIFGGEGNGGVIEPRVVSVRDSLVGMAMMLQYIAETGKPLSELAAEIPSYHLLKTKLTCPTDAAGKVAEKTKMLYADRPGVKFDESDGLRIDFDNCWVSVRASNTEPIMRIFAEAPTEEQAQEIAAEVKTLADEVLS